MNKMVEGHIVIYGKELISIGTKTLQGIPMKLPRFNS
jgi:hypothetical protein